MTTHDLIVIGGGHNGLVCAAYAARAGLSVLVLERRDIVGGACVTEETWPGCRVSTAAYVNSLLRPEIVRELELAKYGFAMLPREPSSFTPFPDGRSLLLGADAELCRREIGQFSQRDADAYAGYEATLDRIAATLEPLADGLPGAAELAAAVDALGADRPVALDLLTASARHFLDGFFESEHLKVTLATDGVIGVFAPPSAPGTAYALFHHVMGEGGGKRGVWGYVRGGMGTITQALAATARTAGAEIRTGVEVGRILTERGRACGVALADGTEYRAQAVASNATAHVTFLKLLDARDVPADYAAQVRRIDYASASLKINVLLGELPDFTARPGASPGPQHRGTVHLCPDFATLEQAYADAAAGRPSHTPLVECGFPSVVDGTLAPPGQYVMSMFIQYAPYQLAAGDWSREKERFADRVFDVVSEYAPNFKRAVLARQVLSPVDLEEKFGLTGGNIFQGALVPRQLYALRGGNRTPVPGLYLCGAAAHPGGGVYGAPGRNAARAIVADRAQE